MYSLIQLFVRHGGLITLVVAQVISLYLMTSQNSPQQEIARLTRAGTRIGFWSGATGG